MFLSDKGTYTLETLDISFHIGSTPTFLYFDLYLNTARATHYVYLNYIIVVRESFSFNRVVLNENRTGIF